MHLVNQGRGKGVATYYNNEFKVSGSINKELYQISKVISQEFDVINIYCSKGANKSDFLRDLGSLANAARPTFLIGDLNINFLNNPKDRIVIKILSNGFKQLVSAPTHIEGGLLDHIYIKQLSFEPHIVINFPYYSDHGAISVFSP